MFRIKRGMGCLLTLSLLAAGCAKTPFNLSNRERTTLTPVRESQLMNAKDAATPAILPETHYAAGRLFESQGQFGKALEQYRKSVAVNHHFAKGYHRLGLVFSKVSRHEEAVDALRRAVELDPNNAQLRNNYGFELMFVLDWAEAELQLRRAIELEPRLARAQVNLAMALSKQHRFDEALEAFRQVLPEPDAYYNLGLLYRGQQRYEQATEAFQHVLELNPGFSAASKQLHELVRLAGGDSIGASTPQSARLTQGHVNRSSQTTENFDRQPVPATPRRIGEDATPRATVPRTFWKSARQPEPDQSETPAVRDFTSVARITSEPIDYSESVEMSYLDEFPTPVVEGDIVSSVALIEDELDCIRAELEASTPDYVADNDALVTAIEGVPSPYVLKASPFIDEDPVFEPEWSLAPPAGYRGMSNDSAQASAFAIGRPAKLIGAQPRRVATAVAQSATTKSDLSTPVDAPIANPKTGEAFARATWPDAAASSNPRFHNRNELMAMDKALDLVRGRIRSLEREDDTRTRAYAAARADRYRAQLASTSGSQPMQTKYAAGPKTLRDFARAQLNGDGPDSLEAILIHDQSQVRPSNRRSKKSTLVNDKPPVRREPRSRPRTDARNPDWNPPLTTPSGAQPWYAPLLVPADEFDLGPGPDTLAVGDAWLNDFDELDSLIAIIRNEVICEGSLKTEIAVPSWADEDRVDVCTLDPEPIMSELPASELLNVCDPSQPDDDIDGVTIGQAHPRGGRLRP